MEATVSSNKYRTLLSDIMIFIIGTVLAKAIQFILMPLYTTYMSTEAYGIAELTNNLSELFFPIATLCVYEAAFRFAVDPEFSNRKLATAVAKVMLISSGIGLFIAIFVKSKRSESTNISLNFEICCNSFILVVITLVLAPTRNIMALTVTIAFTK